MSEIFVKHRIKAFLKGNLRRYLLFGFVEIFLVVAGILIALAINNWNTKRSLRNDEVHIYRALREKLVEDKKVILDDAEYNNTYLVQFRYADRIISENDRSALDTLEHIVPKMFSYSDFDKSSTIYQDLANSGEVKILNNPDITSRLQELEETYFYMNRLETIHWETILEIVGKDVLDYMNLSTVEAPRPELLYAYPFHNRFILLIRIMEEKNGIYQRTLRQIDQLTELIDEEIAR